MAQRTYIPLMAAPRVLRSRNPSAIIAPIRPNSAAEAPIEIPGFQKQLARKPVIVETK